MSQAITLPLFDTVVPADITIIGLGPGPLADLSLVAWQVLLTSRHVVFRTARHPCIEALSQHLQSQGVRKESCDNLYEQHDEFADVYDAITHRIVTLGRAEGGVVYAVPGSPWVGEATTSLIHATADAANLSVTVIGAMSFVEPAFAIVGVDLMDGGQVVDAMMLAQQHHPQVNVSLPLLIGQLYARWLASDLKLTLLNAYPASHPVTLIQSAGMTHQRTQSVPLYELDHRDDFDHLTTLYVPPLTDGRSFTDLQEIVAYLRAPEGCPWDQVQTLESLRQDLLGECAEVLEAIDVEAASDGAVDNGEHIAEELGDLLLLVTMMIQIAIDEGRFQMADVAYGIVTKLIRRHPHVFGDIAVDDISQIEANWEDIKAQEQASKANDPTTDAINNLPASPWGSIPPALPALEKARKTQSKAAKAGLLDRAALGQRTPELLQRFQDKPQDGLLGELLWSLVALAKAHDLNPEDALRTWTVGFRQRHT